MNATMPAEAGGAQAFVPGFEIDVFVSYGHFDNQPEQWVTKLYELLKAQVESIVGESINFWIDPQLNGGEILDTALKHRVSSSAVFLPVLSPRYVKSPYCRQELQWFHDTVTQNGALCVGDRCRILPIEKYPPQELPEPLAKLNVVSIPFHATDPASRMVDTFPAERGLAGYSQFRETYHRLAANLADLLIELRKTHTAQQSAGKTVFVAAVAPDKRMERERLANYLGAKGYRVTGSQSTPETLAEVIAATEQDLATASLAIHLNGASYGIIPADEESKSAVWLQFEQAKKSGKRQLVWLSKDTEATSPRQKALLDLLANAGDQQTEVLQTCFSEFLDALPEELEKLKDKPKQRDTGVYVICDRGDLGDTELKALRGFLEKQGFPVIHPAFQGDAGLLRELEEECIAANHATLIYYGSAPDAWVMLKRRAVLKVLQTLKAPPYPARALYLKGPQDDIKTNVYMEYSGGKGMPEGRGSLGPLLVLGDCTSFQPEKVKPLLDILEHQV